MRAPDVDLVTESLVEVPADGVRTTADRVPADAVVLGTGFLTQQLLARIEVRGRGPSGCGARWPGT